MFSRPLTKSAAELLDLCRTKRLRLATAESCTGGLLAALLTSIPGSSDVVEAGFVTYSNEAKQTMLGVAPALIKKHGAVSEEVARAMAEGAAWRSRAEIAVAITGVAGPGGGTAKKPVGLVWIACAAESCETAARKVLLRGRSRDAIRLGAVRVARKMLYEAAEGAP